jgi:hypothetical protein
MKLKNKTLYHRTKAIFKEFDYSLNYDESGVWFSLSEELLKDYKQDYPVLMKRTTTRELNLITEKSLSKLENTKAFFNSSLSFINYMEWLGYDGISYGDTIQLFNPNKTTKEL